MSLGDGVTCSYSPDYNDHDRLMVPKLCFGLTRKDSVFRVQLPWAQSPLPERTSFLCCFVVVSLLSKF